MRASLRECLARFSAISGIVERHDCAGRAYWAHRWRPALERADRALIAARLRHAAERETLIRSALDDFDGIPDEAITEFGGVHVYRDGIRIVGVTSEQAGRQYGRLKQTLMEHGIHAEMAEWKARDVWLQLAGIPNDTFSSRRQA